MQDDVSGGLADLRKEYLEEYCAYDVEGGSALVKHMKDKHVTFHFGTNPWGAGGKRFYGDSSDEDEEIDAVQKKTGFKAEHAGGLLVLAAGLFVDERRTPKGGWPLQLTREIANFARSTMKEWWESHDARRELVWAHSQEKQLETWTEDHPYEEDYGDTGGPKDLGDWIEFISEKAYPQQNQRRFSGHAAAAAAAEKDSVPFSIRRQELWQSVATDEEDDDDEDEDDIDDAEEEEMLSRAYLRGPSKRVSDF